MTNCLEDSTVKTREIGTLAESVMSILANRSQILEDARIEHRASELLSVLATEDPDARDAFLKRCAQRGVSAAHFIDRVIPEAARQIGIDWVEDRADFATVTLQAARLHALLNEIHARSAIPDPADPRAAILLCLMSDDHHRLGARVVASRLMRAGYAVRTVNASEPDAVDASLRGRSYDALFFSCSNMGAAQRACRLVEGLRARFGQLPVTVLGGLCVDHDRELDALASVDLVTNDLEKALLQVDGQRHMRRRYG